MTDGSDADEQLQSTTTTTVAAPTKRVRFSTITSANDITRLAIVNDPEQVEAAQEIGFFSPAFTYHAFGREEQIEGYDGLRIDVLFNAYTFDAHVHIRFQHQESTRSDDLLAKLTPSLPAGFTTDREAFTAALGTARAAFAPPGELVASYHVDIDDRTRRFEVYVCPLEENVPAQRLHAKLQTMALWFIEGADGIDVTDPRWVLYVLYERPIERRDDDDDDGDDDDGVDGDRDWPNDNNDDAQRTFFPVGYVTLFKFRNPLGRKLGGYMASETHRICQALVFPTHQRQGHGERLLEVIYGRVLADPNVYEITVEDPVPGFSKLRDLVDAKQCIRRGFFAAAPHAQGELGPACGTTQLETTDIEAVQEALKLTQRQIQRCYELLKLRFVDRSDELVYKKYRLEVKKRLFKAHAEELEGMGPERRKAYLETAYRDLEATYDELLRKLSPTTTTPEDHDSASTPQGSAS